MALSESISVPNEPPSYVDSIFPMSGNEATTHLVAQTENLEFILDFPNSAYHGPSSRLVSFLSKITLASPTALGQSAMNGPAATLASLPPAEQSLPCAFRNLIQILLLLLLKTCCLLHI